MSEGLSVDVVGEQCQISGMLDFTTAKDALDKVGSLVQTHERLQVSFENVTQCNSAAVALMIELKAVARRQGHEVTFQRVPEGLMQLASVCQVDSFVT